MRIEIQPARVARSYRRAFGLAVSVILLTFLGLINPAVAQEGGNQAGLVVQFGDGSLYTACVDLGASGQATGEQVLRAAGLYTSIDYSSGFGGGTVCRIGNEGCNFPAEPCFCQCTMKPGEPCIYWTYFHLLDGQWRYANQGASIHTVRSGDVEGWVWGLGAVGAGAQPPVITFEQICSVSSQAVRPSPTIVSFSPTATGAPLPTRTAPVLQPTATSPPAHTPSLKATRSPTKPPPSTSTSQPETPMLPQPSETTTYTPTPSPTPTREPLSTATSTLTSEAAASNIERGQLAFADKEQSPLALPTEEAELGSGKIVSYIVFGVLAALLVGGLVYLRVR